MLIEYQADSETVPLQREQLKTLLEHVDEEIKQTRLQGLKDQLAGADEDTTELRAEIEELEQCITELTSFDSGTSLHTHSTGG